MDKQHKAPSESAQLELGSLLSPKDAYEKFVQVMHVLAFRDLHLHILREVGEVKN